MRSAESTEPAAITGSEVARDDRLDQRVNVAVVAVGEQVDAVDAEVLGAARVVGDLIDRAAQQARVADDASDVGEEAGCRCRR